MDEKSITVESYASGLESNLKVAQLMLKSGLVPSSFKTPEAVVVAIWYGRELGFSPLRALSCINVVAGKPTVDSAGLKALAIERGGKIETLKWDKNVCRLKCTRGDWVEEYEFTMDDAQSMGLANKDNWKKMPKFMLYARCVSVLVRNMFADAIGGFYSKEEMEDSVLTQERKPVEIQNGYHNVVEVEAIPPEAKAFWAYDLASVPDDKKASAEKFALSKGLRLDDKTGLWIGKERIKSMDKYQVDGTVKLIDGKLEINIAEAQNERA